MPLGASVAGLPVCIGNTARSASRRAGQQAHHRRHARLHAELFENVLEMFLHRARAHVEDRGADVLPRDDPARGERWLKMSGFDGERGGSVVRLSGRKSELL